MSYASSNVWVDDWCGRRGVVVDALEVVGFSLLTALLARFRIPLPFTPVPITGQTLGVLLAGAALGARRGFLSQVLYILTGAAGLHVFAGGVAGGPDCRLPVEFSAGRSPGRLACRPRGGPAGVVADRRSRAGR